MSRLANRLTTDAVRRATKAGRYPDGQGLSLIHDGRRRAWQFRWERSEADGKRRGREMSLGSPDDGISLADARQRASDARAVLASGGDPLGQRRQEQGRAPVAPDQTTFRAASGAYIAAKRPGWKSKVHAQQWESTLTTYAFPIIGDLPCVAITTTDVLRVIEPHWQDKTETMSRVAQRIRMILDFARSRDWMPDAHPNVAEWKGRLEHSLASKTNIAPVVHHPALRWQDAPSFMADLRQRDGAGARCLEFTILTCCRSGESRGLTWGEIDLATAVWTLPKARAKNKREWRQPLSGAVMALLKAAADDLGGMLPDQLVFPNMNGGMLSDMTLTATLRRMRVPVTVHGFRSTARQWMANCTDASHEDCEMCLAHTPLNMTSRSYQRDDVVEKRRPILEAWASHCTSAEARPAG
jgi:integrase